MDKKLQQLKPEEQLAFLYKMGNDYFKNPPASDDFTKSIEAYLKLDSLAKEYKNTEYTAKFHKGMATIYDTYKLDRNKTYYHYKEYFSWCRVNCDPYQVTLAAFNLVWINNFPPVVNVQESRDLLKLMKEKIKVIRN